MKPINTNDIYLALAYTHQTVLHVLWEGICLRGHRDLRLDVNLHMPFIGPILNTCLDTITPEEIDLVLCGAAPKFDINSCQIRKIETNVISRIHR